MATFGFSSEFSPATAGVAVRGENLRAAWDLPTTLQAAEVDAHGGLTGYSLRIAHRLLAAGRATICSRARASRRIESRPGGGGGGIDLHAVTAPLSHICRCAVSRLGAAWNSPCPPPPPPRPAGPAPPRPHRHRGSDSHLFFFGAGGSPPDAGGPSSAPVAAPGFIRRCPNDECWNDPTETDDSPPAQAPPQKGGRIQSVMDVTAQFFGIMPKDVKAPRPLKRATV